MLLSLVSLPLLAGVAVWALGDRQALARAVLAVGATAVTGALGVAVAWSEPSTSMRWGSGLELTLVTAPLARAPVVLVPFVAAAVVVYALGYGEQVGRSRMVGLLVIFVGAMELLLLAGDLLTLIIGWELVGVVSWGLIAHHWRTDGGPAAAKAYLTVRGGDLGLVLAAGAAYTSVGSLDFVTLAAHDTVSQVLVAGVLLAAAAKSAQVPFAPWLFRAMAGPTPASALLHSATMVSAGAYLVARLHPVLDRVSWFGPTAIGIGLTTAILGGVVAFLHPEAKKLLAASTSAHYGLMFVAVGAGYPAVAIAHLVAHGLFKALLFVSAGVAIDAARTDRLVGMRLGRRMPAVAALTAVGTVALAAIPPIGAGWTKEKVVASAAHESVWLGAAVIVAGGLSALYAARFQLVAYGSPQHDVGRPRPFRLTGATVGLSLLAAGSLALSLLWVPGGEDALRDVTGGSLPSGATWELVASLAVIVVALYAAVHADRRGVLAAPATTPGLHAAAAWLGIGAATRVAVVEPVLRLAALGRRFDDRVVDGGVRGAAGVGRILSQRLSVADDRVVDAGVRGTARAALWWSRAFDRVAEVGFDGAVEGLARLTGEAGRDGRRLQTGQTHQYYAGVALGLALLVFVVLIWS